MQRRAIRTTAVLLVALGVSAAGLLTAQPDGSVLAPHVPGEAIVAFRDGSAIAKSGVLAEIDATGIETLGSTGALLVRLNGMTVEEAITRLAGHPEVAFVEPNFLYSTQRTPDDPEFGRLWGMHNEGQTGGTPGADIRAPAVWELYRGTRAVLVAVIDTGVDYTHPDLAANIWTNPAEIPDNGIDDDGNGYVDDVSGWDFVNDDNDPMDDHFHGTHVAGTVGAVGDNGTGIVGVNWEVSILPLKFLDDEGLGTTATAIAAVDYAVDNGARILNNSWGGPGFSQALRLAIERANRNDVLFVAAAGNNLAGGRDNDFFPFFPATYPTPNIIAVAATDHDDLLGSFSNFGREAVDLAAPGVDVYSTFPGNDYGFLNGTSMATPHVVGALALLLGRYPAITALDAKALLFDNVDAVPALAGRMLTGGRLNAWRLMADPDDVSPAAVTDLRVGNPDANRVDLTWTATGDDDRDGTASRYDLRFATFPIDDGNFDSATPATGRPTPGPPGTPESMRVTGLAADTTYWFALRVLDEYGNASAASNAVEQRTLGPPVILVAPESIAVDLFTGESVERTLSLDNLGIGELLFEVVVEGISPTPVAGVIGGRPQSTERPVAGYGHGTVGAFDIDQSPVAGPPPHHSAVGGNKEVTDATAANGSAYSYHEFDAPAGHFNGIYQTLDAAHPVYVSFWVRPGSKRDNDGYVVIRDSTGSDAIFFYATSSGYFHVNGDVGGNVDVPYTAESWYHVEFRDVDFSETTFDYYVDGLLIQPDVRFRFPSVRDFDRLDLYNFDGGSEAWWDEIVLTELPPVLPVAVDPGGGILAPGGRAELNVRLDATGLNGGLYDASIVVASNDPARPEWRVPVQLRVTGAPDIALSDRELDFGALFLRDVSARTLTIENRGTDLLALQGLTVDHPDFSLDPTPFELAPGETHDLSLAFLPTIEGAATARLTITSNDPDEPILEVTLGGIGLLPPDIEVTPAVVSVDLVTGGTADVALQVDNSGFSDLAWEIAFAGDPHPTLEAVLEALDDGHGSVTDAIPGLHPLIGGHFGTSIANGGNNLFGIGNFLSTDRGGFLEYSDGVIATNELLGETGRYFTRRYPGLFVLAADLDDASFFNVAGSVGTGAQALLDGASLVVRANGLRFRVFAMRSSATQRPSLNHLVIVEDRPGTAQRFQGFSNQYSHVVYGLGESTRLYYLMFGGIEGRYYADTILTYVANVFFDVLNFGPLWIEAGPRLAQIGPGTTATLDVRLDAFGLDGGEYGTILRVLTNIPDRPVVEVPVSLNVTAAPDIALSRSAHEFDPIFVGQTLEADVVVFNHGTVELHVDTIASDHPAFVPAGDALTIVPGENATFGVTFAPLAVGTFAGHVLVTSDDPDEPVVSVALTGIAGEPPVSEVGPTQLDVVVRSGRRAYRSFVVRNLAGAVLTFDVVTEFSAASGAAVTAPDDTVRPVDDEAFVGTLSQTRAAEPGATIAFAPPPRPFAKTGSGEPAESFFFADGFEDGLLDGWFGLGPPASNESDDPGTNDTAPLGRRRSVTGDTPWRSAPRHGPVDIAVDIATADAGKSGPAKGGTPRLSATPTEGAIDAGDEQTVQLTIDADRLLRGDYIGLVRVLTNDPVRPEIVVTVDVHVEGDPIIGAAPSELAFGEVAVGVSAERSITVTNLGAAPLTVDVAGVDHPSFTVETSGFELAPGRSRAVGVTFEPDAEGPVTATLELHNNSPAGTLTVPLSGTGIEGAELVVSPAELDQVQFRGATFVRTVTIENHGGAALDFSVAVRPVGSSLTTMSLFADDMESGIGAWTTETFGGDNLWSWNDVVFNSPAHGWGCMNVETGTYATANPVSAAVVSPPVDLRGIDSRVALRFHESFTTEPGWDQCMVDASTDGGIHWTPLRGAYGSAPSGSSRGWVQENLDLTPFNDEIVNLRFYFETIDAQNNAFPGWAVDDVRVETEMPPWIVVSPVEGTLEPGAAIALDVTLTTGARPVAVYGAELEITSSAPLTPFVVVPVRLDTRQPPRAALQGGPTSVVSIRDFFAVGARTDHALELPVRPAGPGTLTLDLVGDFGEAATYATLTAEALPFGALGTAGGSGACGTTSVVVPLSSDELASLAADGLLAASVRNSAAVEPNCNDNRHVVNVDYVGELQQLDFAEVVVGRTATLPLLITNSGAADLIVATIGSSAADITADPASAAIPPQATVEVAVTWQLSSESEEGTLDATLDLATNDPARPEIRLPLRGTAVATAPAVVVDTTPLVAALPPGGGTVRTRTLALHNAGSGELTWDARPFALGTVEPASGIVAPGDTVGVAIHLTAADLPAGDYDASLVLDTNDPARPRIDVPLTLHVRLVGLDVFAVDFTPKFATRPGTVEVILQVPSGFETADVLPGTVSLQGVTPDPTPVLMRDLDHDGVDELILQFDVALVDAALPVGDTVPVETTGEIDSRAWFHATTWVRGRIEVDPDNVP